MKYIILFLILAACSGTTPNIKTFSSMQERREWEKAHPEAKVVKEGPTGNIVEYE